MGEYCACGRAHRAGYFQAFVLFFSLFTNTLTCTNYFLATFFMLFGLKKVWECAVSRGDRPAHLRDGLRQFGRRAGNDYH